MMSLPPPPLTVSLPTSVVIQFSPELPVSLLFYCCAALIAAPVSVRFSKAGAEEGTELLTVSFPSAGS
jgi:hypothetical protein